jgi:AcrR family transcriptional regulator
VNNGNIPKRRGYHHGNLRAALISATLRAIADEGPEGFTLRDVARRAGVSPAAPYRHFADKDELLTAVASECMARLTAATAAAAAEAEPDPLSQFRANGVAYVQFAAAHPEHFRVIGIPGLSARLPPDDRARLEASKEAQRAAIIAAQKAGVIADIPIDELLLAANSLVHGLAHLIVEGQLGPVSPARARELAIASTGALGLGFIPRPDSPDWKTR